MKPRFTALEIADGLTFNENFAKLLSYRCPWGAPDAHQFALSGELTMQTVPTVSRESADLISKMSGDVKINLAEVVRADSAGLALLIDWLRAAQRNKFRLEFEHLPEQLMQIARVSELHEVLPIHDS